MSREVMKQALEALENQRIFTYRPDHEGKEVTPIQVTNAITALKQALAEPEQEPYAWMAVGGSIWRHKTSHDDVPLYTAPVSRKPMTEDEIRALLDDVSIYDLGTDDLIDFARAIEKAHGIGEQT